jgi:hypothetical protein
VVGYGFLRESQQVSGKRSQPSWVAGDNDQLLIPVIALTSRRSQLSRSKKVATPRFSS